jgi:RNA polymerase sigma-70 factor (ECF subfamily)
MEQAENTIVDMNEMQKEIVLKVSIEQEISRLPEEFREVVLLHYFQDLKFREIAEILGINISLVSESKKLLKNSIDKEDFYEYSFETKNSSI